MRLHISWSLPVGILSVLFIFQNALAVEQRSLRSATIIEKLIALGGPEIKANASVIGGFGEEFAYKDQEVSFSVHDGGEIEIVGEAMHPKNISDYSNRIAVNDLGRVEIAELRPVTVDGVRKVRFVMRITVDAASEQTSYGVIRKRRSPVTLEYLQEACMNVGQTAGGMIPQFDCESYVYGVLDAYLRVRDWVPINQRSCFPANIPPWRVLEIVEHSNLNYKFDDIAAPLLIEALRKKFPCSK